jgi:hypothetical protein
MKLGVIADIHGNEVALRAVLGDAARCHVDRSTVWSVASVPSTRQHRDAAAAWPGRLAVPSGPRPR